MFLKRYYKSIQELRGFTSVDISSKTIKEIEETLDEYKKSNNEYDIGIPLKEGVIINRGIDSNDTPSMLKEDVENTKIAYYFKINEKEEGMYLLWEEYMYNPKGGYSIGTGAYEVLIGDKLGDIRKLDYIDKENPPIFNLIRNKINIDSAKSGLAFLISSLLYIGVVQSSRKVVYRQSKGMSFNSKSNTNNKKKTNTIKIEVLNGDKVMYTMDGNEGVIKGFKTYTRKTESWLVLGHWRKYKNGNKKWINSYIKGEGKQKPKHYKVK